MFLWVCLLIQVLAVPFWSLCGHAFGHPLVLHWSSVGHPLVIHWSSDCLPLVTRLSIIVCYGVVESCSQFWHSHPVNLVLLFSRQIVQASYTNLNPAASVFCHEQCWFGYLHEVICGQHTQRKKLHPMTLFKIIF